MILIHTLPPYSVFDFAQITIPHNSPKKFRYGIIGGSDKMKFKMNNHEWEIKEETREEIKRIYERETEEETLMVYGLTKYDSHEI